LNAVYQLSSDLELGVTNRELDCAVTVLDQKALDCGPWRFTFSIIGESHTVRIERNGVLVWQEILACVKLSPDNLIHYFPLKKLGDHSWECGSYTTKIRCDETPLDLWAVDDELRIDFPVVYGKLPYTWVGWSATANRVRWQTLHVYQYSRCTVHVSSESSFYVH
jgi:hypothetical protein